MTDEGVARARSFYGRWARLYDAVARYTPGVGTLRERAAAALRLDPGDVVVDMGCGTGANLPYLRERVGPGGTVIGVDFTRGMLERAGRLVDSRGWENVHLVHADATRPPVGQVPDGIGRAGGREAVDGVLASFVSGMLDDPAGTVGDWCDLARGGHVVLLDAARSEEPIARPLNVLFRALVICSTPPTRQVRYPEDHHALLDERVGAAHGRLRERASGVASERHVLGFVRLTGGRL